MAKDRIDLVVGTYSRLGGRGLAPLVYDGEADAWTVGEPVADVTDASFGVYAPRVDRHYFVEEADQGRVSCHLGPDRRWRRLATTSTDGGAPCHAALDPDQRRLAVANYESGSVALYRLNPADGLPLGGPATYQLEGQGPNAERQEHSHAHWVGFDATGERLYTVDLGADRIAMFTVDRTGSSLARPAIAYQAPPGSGPRHLAFHPTQPLAFLVSELASTLTVLRMSADGTFEAIRIVSTLPQEVPDSLGGAIAITAAGDRVYVTNRGHDSVAVFGVAGEDVTPVQHVPSGGASPRFILLLEDRSRLLVANEEGGSVSVFVLGADGRLLPEPVIIDIPGAVFLGRVEEQSTKR